MLNSCNSVAPPHAVRRKGTRLCPVLLLAISFVLLCAEPSHAGDCQVFCDGSFFGSGPRASAQECLDTLCLAPPPNLSSCGFGSGTVTDCKFDGVSILPPPVCGNDVRERAEACDGLSSGCDQGFTPCEPDCSCPPGSTSTGTCGDNVVNLPGEQCDGTDDLACPGLCQSNCTCPSVPPQPSGIPTVSEWGVVIIALMLLIGSKVYFSRRRSAEVSS